MIHSRRSGMEFTTGGRPPCGNAGGTRRALRVFTPVCPCLVLAALVFGGCAATVPPERQHYIIEASRQGPPVQTPVDAAVQVHQFNVDAAFAPRTLVYRLGEFRYEADYYRQFLISPSMMITEQTREWLADARLFNRVLPAGSRIAPDYLLEANVTALYGDFSSESASTAVMDMQFFLVEEADGQERVVFAKTYRAVTPVPNRTAEVFVKALSKDLGDILSSLETDLQKAVVARGKTPNP